MLQVFMVWEFDICYFLGSSFLMEITWALRSGELTLLLKCMTSGNLLLFTEPQFPHLEHGLSSLSWMSIKKLWAIACCSFIACKSGVRDVLAESKRVEGPCGFHNYAVSVCVSLWWILFELSHFFQDPRMIKIMHLWELTSCLQPRMRLQIPA